ncbi:MAG: 2-keto-3-deoxygluconate permease [Synergistaceae bacterium]
MKFPLLSTMKKVPGGLMLVPMFVAAFINSYCPQILDFLPVVKNAFTSKGTMTIIGIMLFIMGVQLRTEHIRIISKRCGVLMLAKIFMTLVFGTVILHFCGRNGVWGISALAWIGAVSSCNPGLHVALMENYGDEVDKLAFGPLNIFAVPIIPICLLGFSDGYGLDYEALISIFSPIVLGYILGCLDEDIRTFTKDGNTLLLPFMGFCLGGGINIPLAMKSSLSALVLTVSYLLLNFITLYCVDRYLLKQRGHSAAAMCSVAGLSLTLPTIMALKNPLYEPMVRSAEAQLGLAVLLSSVAVPFLVNYVVKHSK